MSKKLCLSTGDGDWFSGHTQAIATAKELFNKHGIPTFSSFWNRNFIKWL